MGNSHILKQNSPMFDKQLVCKGVNFVNDHVDKQLVCKGVNFVNDLSGWLFNRENLNSKFSETYI